VADSYLTASREETPRYEGAPTTAPYRIATERFWFPIDSGLISANPQHLDRANELRGLLAPPAPLIDGYEPGGNLSQRFYPNNLVVLLAMAGLVPTITEGDATNEVQTLTGTGVAAGDTWTIELPVGLGGETTVNLAGSATAATIKAALEDLDGVRPGDVVVTGGPVSTAPVVITFQGRLAGQTIGVVTADSSAGSIAVVQTTPGSAGTVQDPDGNGVPAGAYLVEFAKATGAVAPSAQIIAAYGPQGVYLKGQGFGVSTLTMNAAGDVTADLMGLVVKRIADPGLTPDHDAPSVLPLRRGDLTINWLTGGARIQDFSLSLANSIERGEDLSIGGYFPKHLEFTGEPQRLTGSITKGQIDADDYDALLAATTFSATASWQSPATVGASGKSYGVWVEMPACVHTGGDPDALANARRFGATFDFGAYLDESTDRDFVISVVCGVESVATFA
jgi:hypothetical protein